MRTERARGASAWGARLVRSAARLSALLASAALLWPADSSAALARHVVLVDWDGFEPALLNRGYSLPNLQSLASRGSRSTAAQGTFSSFSNPVRASLSTGAYPERHGNVAHVFDPSANFVFGQTRNMAVETVAEALRRSSSGKTMASVQWYMVQDRGVACADPKYLYVQPGGQFGDRVNVAIEILKRRPVNSCGTTVTVPKIPNFLAVYGPQPDEVAHNEGTTGPNMKATMEQQDRDLGRLIQATKNVGIYKNTAFIVTSDHGMTDWDKTALPVLSQAVSEAGYTSEVVFPGSSPQGDTDVVISPAVRIAHFHFRGPAASDPDAAQKIRSALQARPEIESVLGPGELSSLRASSKLGDLVAEARPPWSVANAQPAAVKASHGAQAEMDLPLYMAGAGINRTPPSSPGIVDVAPTISALLDVPCPAQTQGRPLRESFTSSASCPSSSVGTSSIKSADVVVAQSTFDESREGWRVRGDSRAGKPEVRERGGNPEGYLQTTDSADGETLYWEAPEPFLGDRRESYGSTLTFDLRESKDGQPGKERGKHRSGSDKEPDEQSSGQDDEDTPSVDPPTEESQQGEQRARASQADEDELVTDGEPADGDLEDNEPREGPDDEDPGDGEHEDDTGDEPTEPVGPGNRDASRCGEALVEPGDNSPEEADRRKDREEDRKGRKRDRRSGGTENDSRGDELAEHAEGEVAAEPGDGPGEDSGEEGSDQETGGAEETADEPGPPDPDKRDVILCGDGLALTYDLEVEPSMRLFAYYQIPLTEQGWVSSATGEPATRGEMRKALSSLEELFIRAEYRKGSVSDDIDNVVLRQRP